MPEESTMDMALNILIFFGIAGFWEFVAWFMHKYVMHGPGWFLHEDHHRVSGKRLQKNDAYAAVFAFISFLCIFFGMENSSGPLTAAGFGIALYGLGYVIFHDIMFHRRIKGLRITPRSGYFKGIITAHRRHHSTTTRYGAVSFNFLWAPKKYTEGGSEDPG
jgi:beta-carotene 3-hydroxylase